MNYKIVLSLICLFLLSCNNGKEELNKRISELESENTILRDSISGSIAKGVAELDLIIGFSKSAFATDEKIEGLVSLCGLNSYPNYSVYIVYKKTGKDKLILTNQTNSRFSFAEEIDENNISKNEFKSKLKGTYGVSFRIEFEQKEYNSVTSGTSTADLLPLSLQELNEKLNQMSLESKN